MKNEHYISHLFKSYKNFKQKSGFKKSNYFKERKIAFKKVSKDLNVSYCSLFFDYLCCLLFVGENWQFYLLNEMYKYKFSEKRKRLTVLRAFNLDYKYNKYATDEERERLNNKSCFDAKYQSFVKREFILPKESKKEEVVNFVKKHQKVFCKPNRGTEGNSCEILCANDLTNEKLDSLLKSNYLLEEVIDQHEAVAKLHPNSINTVRIFSIIDKSGNVHLMHPCLRAGIDGNIVDNVFQGGILYLVDLNTGKVNSDGIKLGEAKKYETHPGTNIKMKDFQIPYYKEICDMIVKAALVTKSLRFVGWDVAVGKNGPILLEGNIAYAATVNGDHGIYKEMKQYLRK